MILIFWKAVDKGIISMCGFIFDLSKYFRALEEMAVFSKVSLIGSKYSNNLLQWIKLSSTEKPPPLSNVNNNQKSCYI